MSIEWPRNHGRGAARWLINVGKSVEVSFETLDKDVARDGVVRDVFWQAVPDCWSTVCEAATWEVRTEVPNVWQSQVVEGGWSSSGDGVGQMSTVDEWRQVARLWSVECFLDQDGDFVGILYVTRSQWSLARTGEMWSNFFCADDESCERILNQLCLWMFT